MKRNLSFWILLLTFAVLFAPGSPSIVLDGLPLGGRLEVAALALACTALFSRRMRETAQELLGGGRFNGLALFVLVVILSLKLFTFFRFPLGENFEVCLKSKYEPRNELCEKSFDFLFHSSDGVNGFNDITRIEETINFGTTTGDDRSLLGASHSSWNLPFQNEFPRLSKPWLDRLPFTAAVGAVIESRVNGYVPVEFVGMITASSGQSSIQESEFEHRRVIFLPVAAGDQRVRVDLEFADDDQSVVPDDAPPARGPYAHLVLGDVVSEDSSPSFSMKIRGFAANTLDSRNIARVEVRHIDQTLVAITESRPDVADFLGDERFESSGFWVEVPIGSVFESSRHEVVAVLNDGDEYLLAAIQGPDLGIGRQEPSVVANGGSPLKAGVDAWLTMGKEPPLLTAQHFSPPGLVSQLLLWIVNISLILMFFGLMAVVLLRAFYRKWKEALGSTVIAVAIASLVIVVHELDVAMKIPFLPATAINAMLLVIPIFWIHIKDRIFPGLYIALVALLISFRFAIDSFRNSTGLGDHSWWGFMIFRERVMDWFVFQGYAYQILVQQSLRAGENLFYFMPGSRYFVFLSHILFGNNDVLIGVLLYALLVGSMLWVGHTFIGLAGTELRRLAPALAVPFTLLIVGLSALSVQLSISSSSEVFSWVLFFSVIPIVIRSSSYKGWFLTGVILGLVVFLRPNYLMVSLVLCLALTFFITRLNGQVERLQRATSRLWLWLGFTLTSLLALAHNMYYANSLVLFTNRADPNQTVFEPMRIFDFFSDDFVREVVFIKLESFLYWGPPSLDIFLVASWMSQLIYVAAVIDVFRKPYARVSRSLILLAPVLYVVSAVPFGIMTIPERQFNMATFSLVISAVASMLLVGHFDVNRDKASIDIGTRFAHALSARRRSS